jgi:hypothetical protein
MQRQIIPFQYQMRRKCFENYEMLPFYLYILAYDVYLLCHCSIYPRSIPTIIQHKDERIDNNTLF